MTFTSEISVTTSVANWICISLGVLAIALNVFVIVLLLLHRRKFLKHIFYFLVFHCSVVEVIQSAALIVWCLPTINIFSIQTLGRLMLLKQWVVIFLRSMNIMTLLNLLLFTLNEFVLVKKPLLYRRITRRKIVAVFIVLNWVLSFTVGVSHVLGKKFSKSPPTYRVYVSQNFTVHNTTSYLSLIKRKEDYHPESDKSPLMLATIIICIVCLLAVVTCYAVVMKRIRDVRNRSPNPPQPNLLNPKRIYLRQVSHEPPPTRFSSFSKHKYIIVIITILFVYSLFIIPYLLIQGLQYIHMSKMHYKNIHQWAEPLWILQVFVGLHSVLQPLCYFRMKEFRRTAYCGLSRRKIVAYSRS